MSSISDLDYDSAVHWQCQKSHLHGQKNQRIISLEMAEPQQSTADLCWKWPQHKVRELEQLRQVLYSRTSAKRKLVLGDSHCLEQANFVEENQSGTLNAGNPHDAEDTLSQWSSSTVIEPDETECGLDRSFSLATTRYGFDDEDMENEVYDFYDHVDDGTEHKTRSISQDRVQDIVRVESPVEATVGAKEATKGLDDYENDEGDKESVPYDGKFEENDVTSSSNKNKTMEPDFTDTYDNDHKRRKLCIDTGSNDEQKVRDECLRSRADLQGRNMSTRTSKDETGSGTPTFYLPNNGRSQTFFYSRALGKILQEVSARKQHVKSYLKWYYGKYEDLRARLDFLNPYMAGAAPRSRELSDLQIPVDQASHYAQIEEWDESDKLERCMTNSCSLFRSTSSRPRLPPETERRQTGAAPGSREPSDLQIVEGSHHAQVKDWNEAAKLERYIEAFKGELSLCEDLCAEISVELLVMSMIMQRPRDGDEHVHDVAGRRRMSNLIQ